MLMPLVLRRVWDTIDLHPGPLREDLIAMCRDHRIRVRQVLLWRTHGTMINGAVLGLIGPARYIMLTDALLEMLPGEQVRAVMAHELGHIRRWHMPWLAAAAITAILLSSTAFWVILAMAAPDWAQTEQGHGLVLLGGIVAGLVAFGFASRRFEWQADAFAVQHLSGWRGRRGDERVPIAPEAVSAMAGALGAVAALNHIPLRRFTWRHGSIASRQQRLMRLIGAPAGRLWPDREAALVKALIAAAVLVVTGFGIFTQVSNYLS
jgi:STE24 endopeptidase